MDREDTETEEQTESAPPPLNPADRPLVTLDNNALIALREDEADAPAVRELLALNRAGVIALNVTLNTALENQRAGAPMDMQAQEAWLLGLGIAKDRIFSSWRFVPFSTPEAPNAMTFDPQLDVAFMCHIHKIVAPNIPFDWHVYRNEETKASDKSQRAMAELDHLHHFSGSPSLRPATRHSTPWGRRSRRRCAACATSCTGRGTMRSATPWVCTTTSRRHGTRTIATARYS
jgi:hypothetical protein